MITEFKDYRDLPFSKEIQKQLFKMHCHEEGTEKIIYYEKDVLILLQIMQNEITGISLTSEPDCGVPFVVLTPEQIKAMENIPKDFEITVDEDSVKGFLDNLS